MRFSGEGCVPCRKSRKKCDLTRPTCERCIRTCRDCYGYREAFSIINAEDAYASGQHKRPRGPRAKAEPVFKLNSGLSRDIQSEAVSLYMHHHLAPASNYTDIQGQIRKAVSSTWTSNSALEFAVRSISMAIFSRVKHQPSAAKQASISYQRSIHALQSTLTDIPEDHLDSCLLTISFLARYEDSIYHTSPPSPHIQYPYRRIALQSNLHLAGAVACLSHWMKSSNRIRTPTYAITHARRNLRKAGLLGQINFSEWLQDGGLFGEQGQELELDHILIRLIRLRSHVTSLLSEETASNIQLPQTSNNLEALYVEALAIDAALVRFYQGIHYPEQSLADIAMQIQCNGYRILTHHLLIQALQSTIQAPSTVTHEDTKTNMTILGFRNNLTSIAQDMASSCSAFRHGRVIEPTAAAAVGSPDRDGEVHQDQYGKQDQDSRQDQKQSGTKKRRTLENQEMEPYIVEMIAMPLVIASCTKYIDDEYKDQFRPHLVTIGQVTGYGLLESVATDSWFHL